MKKINKYASTSALMNVKIKYGEESYIFNLYEEIIVDENKINSEIRDQPTGYAFLSMLHKKLIRKAQDKKTELDKVHATLFLHFKDELDKNTGRANSNDVAESKVLLDANYLNHLAAYDKAQDERDTIEVCVKAFEQRKDLIQTLSANIRKEN